MVTEQAIYDVEVPLEQITAKGINLLNYNNLGTTGSVRMKRDCAKACEQTLSPCYIMAAVVYVQSVFLRIT